MVVLLRGFRFGWIAERLAHAFGRARESWVGAIGIIRVTAEVAQAV